MRKWKKNTTEYIVKSGECLRVTATDFGALGMKFMIETEMQEVGVIVSPKEVDEFRQWLADTTSTEITFLPPKAAETISKVLDRDKLANFLGGKERAVLEQCREGLVKAELIRQNDNLAATKGRRRQI